MSLERAQVVAAARSWIGTPYLHQASVQDVGCDCLGLVRGVWRELIGPEPERFAPYATDWAEATRKERLADAGFRHFTPLELCDVSAGDVLLFRWRNGAPAQHCGIATSATHMVHAHEGACVCEVPLARFWTRRLAYVFAFPDISDL